MDAQHIATVEQFLQPRRLPTERPNLLLRDEGIVHQDRKSWGCNSLITRRPISEAERMPTVIP